MEKINKLKEKAAANEEKQSKAAKAAESSGARCTWTDKQSRQLIAARSVNDHLFDQHNNNDQNKWAIVNESFKAGMIVSKFLIENGTHSIPYPALTEEDFKTPEQCKNRWRIMTAEFKAINMMSSKRNIR